ncbi:single-stranded nucleic acid binding protein [Clostridium sp. CAG:762]|nr:single-stranded nucleic acid binding protein [Clostridium sp. CAG:762]
MKSYMYEGKNKEEAINKAVNELNTVRENLIVEVLEETKGIVKKKVVVKVIKQDEVVDFIKDTLNEITKLMGVNINLEVRKRDESISIKIFSDNNAILIGKNGRTITALQSLIKQMVYNVLEEKISIILDVENYKEKRIKSLEYLARNTAKEVSKTKIEAKLDSMNSYERRIIHEALSNNRYVYTESTGEEPNRCVVIKPKETK